MSTLEISRSHLWIMIVAVVVLLAGMGFGAWRYVELQTTLASTVEEYEDKVAALEAEVEEQQSQVQTLSEAYNDERNRNEEFEDRIEDLGDTVGVLDKLAKTDPQLLAKYSKVYFLNENYKPSSLDTIPKTFSFSGKTYEFHGQAIDHLKDMLEDAKDDDIDLLVLSAFRSFTTQAQLKANYSVTYGSGANTFSADQGYSEHQLGTTVDFTTPELGGALEGFDKTPAYAWLQKNAYKYGFILSYPPDNAHYIFEPWHWRFVGEDLARDLERKNKDFYDLDQREINEYLVTLFD